MATTHHTMRTLRYMQGRIMQRGADVVRIQNRLKKHGFDPGTIDGIFGPATSKAVGEFQRSRGLHVDGAVGPRTRARLTL